MGLLLFFLALVACSHGLASPAEQLQAVRGLIGRVLPSHASLFVLEYVPSSPATDVWEVETVNSQLVLRGSSGVALASALNWWLKYKCNAVYLWQEQQLTIPSPPPAVTPAHRSTAAVAYRYYYNVCTYGYSSAFWHWDRWEREIDWMAMNGINFPLAFVGQEYLWERLFASLSLNMTDVRESWFSNAAFLPWNRMGNLNAWAGPLPENWIQAQVLLQKMILDRQRSFGMQAVLPGFAGHVPPAFVKHFPDANVTTLQWTPEFGNTYFLDPMSKLFQQIGTAWVQQLTALFGTDHFYNADPFNEMNPITNDTSYLRAVSKSIYQSMAAGDPDAVWVLQGWFLLDGWWAPAQAEAFLLAPPYANLIVLDLWAETVPYWKGNKNFYGRQYVCPFCCSSSLTRHSRFIWCMLHDFGGRSGLFATFDAVNTGVYDAFTHAPNMVGIGLTPEAIETNPIIYDFMMEFSWTRQLRNVSQWVDGWATRRYGRVNAVAQAYWQALYADILNCPTDQMAATATPLVMQPHIVLPPTVGCCASTVQYYKPALLDAQWTNLLSAAPQLATGASSDTYLNDVVEIARQVLGDYSFIEFAQLVAAWNASDATAFQQHATRFAGIFTDLDQLLATRVSYLLGVWVKRAELWGVSDADVATMRQGALLQVTSWGPPGPANGLHEYAFKLWSGLVAPYYGARWNQFIKYLSVTPPSSFNRTVYLEQLWAWEESFTSDTVTAYPTVPQGDTLAVATALRAKYAGINWSLVPRPQARQPSAPAATRRRRYSAALRK